jgi:spermidine synthase
MSAPLRADDGPPASANRYLPFLLVLFVGSGCAALIYEIVWLQMLQLVIGSTAVSLGVLLGTFMGGMCLGSLLLPRLFSARLRPLRVYAALECGIGILGLALLFGMPMVQQVYLTVAGHGMAGILLRGVVSAACLLPPTLLMGATLPAISRRLETTPQGVSWLGFFYGGNIAGAVFGCLLAGFYLLPKHDMAMATYVAAVINFSVAMLAFGLDAQLPAVEEKPAAQPAPADTPGVSPVYVAIGLSGMSALGAEVVWTRLLSLLVGGTVYAFSIILAVFLIGLGLGSSVGSWWSRAVARPRLALGCCQMALAGAIAWRLYMTAGSLPYWPINVELSTSPWFNFQLDLVRCLWAVLPPALVWGASFPLALAAAAKPGQDPGRLVGGVYAANTVGAIIGSLWFSLVVIPSIGTQDAQRCLIGAAVVSGLIMLVPEVFPAQPGAAKTSRRPSAVGVVALLAAVALAGVLIWKAKKVPDGLIEYGRYLPTYKDLPQTLYIGEGMNSSVAVTQESGGYMNFHVSGKVEASTEPQDMRLQRMLGHIPALLQDSPHSVLIVGCGAGVTAGTFLQYPSIQRIVICEIEPLIPRFVTPFFTKQNYGIADGVDQTNPRVINGKEVEVVYDDGRHFLLTTQEKFDIITSDPIHPWVKGSAALYTQEYFNLCKQHLNPGGMVTQWVPLYESSREVVQSELKTFFSVFPQGTVWSNDMNGSGYDVVVLGEANPAPIDLNQVQARLSRQDYTPVSVSLNDVGFANSLSLLLTYGGRAEDLEPWLLNADINHDRDLRLQYLAGMASDLYESEDIYNEMKRYRHYPEGLFTDGSAASLRALQGALSPPTPAGQ